MEETGSISDKGKMFLFFKRSRKALEPTDPLIQRVLYSTYPGIRRPRREFDQPRPSGSKVKKGAVIILPLICSYRKKKDKFFFRFIIICLNLLHRGLWLWNLAGKSLGDSLLYERRFHQKHFQYLFQLFFLLYVFHYFKSIFALISLFYLYCEVSCFFSH
jgi:hypothetical protein